MTKDQQAQSVQDAFAENLRRIRVGRKLSQEDLARLTEMHRTEISVLERGRRELIKLSAALEAPLAQFFTGIEWRPLVLSPRVEAMGCFHIIQPEQVNERL